METCLRIQDSLKLKWNRYDDKPRVWVLIPIETKVREYHAKLLLACTLAEAGFGVILARKGILEFNARFLPRGIMFLNSIATERERQVVRYRKMGYTVAAWCEEGVAYRNRESYRNERVSPVVMRHLARFFAWGRTMRRMSGRPSIRRTGKR
jgi:surface carbohydrate biosynthesis protein